MENFQVYKGQFQASRPHENSFFRELASTLNNAFDKYNMRGALYGHPIVKSDPDCLPDNVLVTKHAILIIDSKDVSGAIRLPDEANFTKAHWQSDKGFEIKGGGSKNPFVQLEKQRERLRAALTGIKGLDLGWNPIATCVLLHGEGARIVGSVPGKYHDRFFVATGEDYLGKILDYINVQSTKIDLDEEAFRQIRERFEVEDFKDYQVADRKKIDALEKENERLREERDDSDRRADRAEAGLEIARVGLQEAKEEIEETEEELKEVEEE